MAGLFGKKSSNAPEDDVLDDFEDDEGDVLDDFEDDEGDVDVLALELEPMGPPEHIRMLAQDVVGDDDAKITALYELVKAVLAEGDMPDEGDDLGAPAPGEEMFG